MSKISSNIRELLEENALTPKDYLQIIRDIIECFENDKALSAQIIKPDNIIRDNGIYHISPIDLKVGYDFSSPEVYKGRTESDSSKVYSIALLFYFFLNDWLLPFQEDVGHRYKQKALQKRFNGDQIPNLGSDKLDKIFKNCLAYSEDDRYENLIVLKRQLDLLSDTDLLIESLPQKIEPIEQVVTVKKKIRKKKEKQNINLKISKTKMQIILAVIVIGISILGMCKLILGTSDNQADILVSNNTESTQSEDSNEIYKNTETEISSPTEVESEVETKNTSIQVIETNSEVPDDKTVLEDNSEVISDTKKNQSNDIPAAEPIVPSTPVPDVNQAPQENSTTISPEYEDNTYLTSEQLNSIRAKIISYSTSISGKSIPNNTEVQYEAIRGAKGKGCTLLNTIATINATDLNDLDAISNELCVALDYSILATSNSIGVGINVSIEASEYRITACVAVQ